MPFTPDQENAIRLIASAARGEQIEKIETEIAGIKAMGEKEISRQLRVPKAIAAALGASVLGVLGYVLFQLPDIAVNKLLGQQANLQSQINTSIQDAKKAAEDSKQALADSSAAATLAKTAKNAAETLSALEHKELAEKAAQIKAAVKGDPKLDAALAAIAAARVEWHVAVQKERRAKVRDGESFLYGTARGGALPILSIAQELEVPVTVSKGAWAVLSLSGTGTAYISEDGLVKSGHVRFWLLDKKTRNLAGAVLLPVLDGRDSDPGLLSQAMYYRTVSTPAGWQPVTLSGVGYVPPGEWLIAPAYDAMRSHATEEQKKDSGMNFHALSFEVLLIPDPHGHKAASSPSFAPGT